MTAFRNLDGPARAIRCADAIRSGLRDLQLDVRVGVHTGECELVGEKPAGIAVHTGARIAAEPGRAKSSSRDVKDLVAGSGISFEDRGEHALKGVPGEWRLYAVKRFLIAVQIRRNSTRRSSCAETVDIGPELTLA